MQTECYRDYSDTIKGFDEDTQKQLLLLVTKHLTCDKETQVKFTAALTAFTKLDMEDKKNEINVWMETMESILSE